MIEHIVTLPYASPNAFVLAEWELGQESLRTIRSVSQTEQLALTLDQRSQVVFGLIFIVVVLIFPGGLSGGGRRLRRLSPAPPG